MNYKILLLTALVVFLAACGQQTQSSQNEIETPVSVQELKKSSISKLINTTGTALATYSVELNSEMSGFYNLQTNSTTGKPYKLGDAVKKGQLIIRLEDKEYENGIALESKKLSLEIAEQEQRESSLKQQLQQTMGESSKAIFASGAVTWRKAKDSLIFNTAALLKDLPHLQEKYQTLRKGSRRFLIN